jgi:hypothetical protein
VPHSPRLSIQQADDISNERWVQARSDHGSADETLTAQPLENGIFEIQPNSRRFVMKSFILAAIVALSSLTSLAAVAHADTFTVHGYSGDRYGR